MKTINDSVKKMTLNVDNRASFREVILKDAFFDRSEKVRKRYDLLMGKLVHKTWGSTPQAIAANRKAASKLISDHKRLVDKSIRATCKAGYTDLYRLDLNAAGYRYQLNCRLDERTRDESIVDFDHFTNRHYSCGSDYWAGNDELTLKAGDPLLKELDQIRTDCEEIKDAASELSAVLYTVFGKSRNLGQALEKWPGLSEYVPLILSNSREIVVAGPVIDKRLQALKGGKMSVKEAMKIDSDK